MNAPITVETWLGVLGLLFLEITLGILVAGAVQTWLRTAGWRRAVWIGTFLASLLWLLISLTGMEKRLATAFTQPPAVQRQVVIRTGLSPQKAMDLPGSSGVAASGDQVFAPASSTSGVPNVVWPLWLWLAGSVVLGLWLLGCRVLLAWAWRSGCWPSQSEHSAIVSKLAARLGYPRRVRTLESRGLLSPIAFGGIRPTVGLPAGFWSSHSSKELEAILVHELAHLSRHDPFWLSMADWVLVALWWHPLLWWARHQLGQTSEQAADEACLWVEEGPVVLAGCLVALARQMQDRRSYHRLGMAGFHSGLGRRVERLLYLDANQTRARRCKGSSWICLGASVAFVVVITVGAAWLLPQRVQGQPSLISAVYQAVVPAFATAITSAQTEDVKVAEAANPSQPAIILESQPGDPSLVPTNTSASKPSDPTNASQPDSQVSSPVTLLSDDPIGSGAKGTNQLVTRVFKIDRGVIQQKIETVTGQSTGGTFITNLVRYFKTAGVESFPGRGGGRAIYFNERTGILFVRASEPDMDVIDKSLIFLSQQPPQIRIEARFVETTSDTAMALGFDGSLGQIQMDVFNEAGATNRGPTANGLTTVPGLKTGFTTTGLATTNGLREMRGDELDWAGRPVTNAHNLQVTALLGTAMRGLLTDPQMRVVMRAMEQRTGVDIITAPSVITVSGRQAQIQVCELKTVVTGVNPEAIVQPGRQPAIRVAPMLTSTIPAGPTLDILPVVEPDGLSIRLTAIPSMVEFMGYDEPPRGESIRVWQDGRRKSVKPALPRFRVRQMQAQAVLESGQTMVLGALPVTETMIVKGKSKSVSKRLLVFITATIVDPAGNPQFQPASPADKR